MRRICLMTNINRRRRRLKRLCFGKMGNFIPMCLQMTEQLRVQIRWYAIARSDRWLSIRYCYMLAAACNCGYGQGLGAGVNANAGVCVDRMPAAGRGGSRSGREGLMA